MLKQPTPERVIDIIWFSVASTFCWPLSTYSNRIRILVYKILQIISVINACMLFLALLYSVYVHSDDIIIVFESICLVLAVSQLMVQTIICSVNYKSLQVSSLLYIPDGMRPFENNSIYIVNLTIHSRSFLGFINYYCIVYNTHFKITDLK